MHIRAVEPHFVKHLTKRPVCAYSIIFYNSVPYDRQNTAIMIYLAFTTVLCPMRLVIQIHISPQNYAAYNQAVWWYTDICPFVLAVFSRRWKLLNYSSVLHTRTLIVICFSWSTSDKLALRSSGMDTAVGIPLLTWSKFNPNMDMSLHIF